MTVFQQLLYYIAISQSFVVRLVNCQLRHSFTQFRDCWSPRTDLGHGLSRLLDLFMKLCFYQGFYIKILGRLFWYSSYLSTNPRTCTQISAYTKIALGNSTPSKVSAPTEVEVFSSYDVAVVKIVPIYTCTCISMINNGMISQIDFEIIFPSSKEPPSPKMFIFLL